MNNLSSSPAEGFLPILRRVPLGLAVAVYVVIQSLWSVYGYDLSFHLTDLTTGRILYFVVILLYSLPFFAIVLSHSLTSRLGQVMGFVALGLFFVGVLLLMLFPYNMYIQLAVVPMFVLFCIFSSSRYRLAWILLSAAVLIGVLSSLMSNLFADKTLIYLGIVPFDTIFRYAGLAAFLYLGLVSAGPSSGRQPSLVGDALTKSALPRIFAIVSLVFLFFAMLLLVFTTLGVHIDERISFDWYGGSLLEVGFDKIIPWGLLLAVGYHFAVAAYLFLFMHHRSMGVKLAGMITMGLGILLTVVVFFMVGVTLNDADPMPYKVVACLITLIFVVPLWLAKNGAEGTSRAVLSAVVAGLVVMAGSMLCMFEPQTYLKEGYDVNATNDFVFQLILPYLFLMTTMLAVAFPRLPRRWVFAIMAGFSFLIVMLNFASDIFN
ncbi:MAG: hypothetical protein MR693_03835 [Bacteroidales bacterium]|nr:hypothetical protein [Bacteroidales bacterium]